MVVTQRAVFVTFYFTNTALCVVQTSILLLKPQIISFVLLRELKVALVVYLCMISYRKAQK